MFSNYSASNIYELRLEADGKVHEFGYIEFGYSATALTNTFDLSQGVLMQWQDFDGVNYSVEINGQFFTLQDGGTYKFILSTDGLTLSAQKYQEENLVAKQSFNVAVLGSN